MYRYKNTAIGEKSASLYASHHRNNNTLLLLSAKDIHISHQYKQNGHMINKA